ncbi:MAG: D-aminoacyl-tRNA deacylase [Eggerthellaceae bacterium]|jgi:D-tyrosyl-tRNA(Tyr) deacylase
MRALVQRVTHATVTIVDGTAGTLPAEPPHSIGQGLVVLLGVGKDDGTEQAEKLWRKISRLRIFADESGKTNRALADIGGEVMIVSQFTLYANCKKGNRPSFTQAGAPDAALELFRFFVSLAQAEVPRVAAGEFGADMRVELENDGPFTIWLDTDAL